MAADVGTEEHRAALMRCLGGPWPEEGPLDAVEESEPEIHEDGYSVQEVSYAVGSGERIRALLLLPDAVREEGAAPRAGICVWHQHHGQFHIGKSEPAGRAGEPMHHTGAALAREGYVVLCPDACVFESRQDPTGTLVGGEFERFEFLRQVLAGRSLAWVAVRDCKRAVDYLASRPEVDADRLGCYGHSLGSTTTWLLGPFEPRLKALVGNCCLPTYSGIEDHLLLHCFTNFVPGWAKYGDTPEIAALTAPRALHLNLGEDDKGSPIEHARAGIVRIQEAYAKAGAADNFTSFVEPGVGHVLTPAMWEHVKHVFAKHLSAA